MMQPKGESPPQSSAPPPAAGQGVTFRSLGPAGPLAVFSAVMPVLGSGLLVYNARAIAEFLRQSPYGVGIYVGAFAVFAGLALLPTYVQAILGGYVFGLEVGVPAALAGFVGASVISYELASRLSGRRVDALIEERPKWRAVREALVGRGFWRTLGTIVLLRLPPNSPFAIMNLVMAATEVPRLPYVLGTLIGMAPRTVLWVFFGKGIKELTKESIRHAVPWPVFVGGLVLLVVVLAILSAIGKRAMERVTGGAGADRGEAGREG